MARHLVGFRTEFRKAKLRERTQKRRPNPDPEIPQNAAGILQTIERKMAKKGKSMKQEQEPTPPPIQDYATIEELLFKQVERPKGVQAVKIANVFDNRYRINVWVRVEEDGFEKNKIHSSYFAHLNGNNLEIVQGL